MFYDLTGPERTIKLFNGIRGSQQGLLMSAEPFYLVVDNDARIVLEVEESPVFSPESLPLSDDHSRHHLEMINSERTRQDTVWTGWLPSF